MKSFWRRGMVFLLTLAMVVSIFCGTGIAVSEASEGPAEAPAILTEDPETPAEEAQTAEEPAIPAGDPETPAAEGQASEEPAIPAEDIETPAEDGQATEEPETEITVNLRWYDLEKAELTDTTVYPSTFTFTLDSSKESAENAAAAADAFNAAAADVLAASVCWGVYADTTIYGTKDNIADRLFAYYADELSSWTGDTTLSFVMMKDSSAMYANSTGNITFHYSDADIQAYCESNGKIDDENTDLWAYMQTKVEEQLGTISVPVAIYIYMAEAGEGFTTSLDEESYLPRLYYYGVYLGLTGPGMGDSALILGETEVVTSDYMKYSTLTFPSEYSDYPNYGGTVDVQGYYNDNWIKTTYSNQGYQLVTSGLTGAKVVASQSFAYGGHFVVLEYTVQSTEAISGGKLGIWTDVQIGDNDYAPVSVITENDEIVGFDLVDNHDSSSGCANLNARYMCYFDGKYVESFAGNDYEAPATYWFGYYSKANTHVFDPLTAETASGNYNEDYTVLNNTDSGMAVSWNVNMDANSTKTFYVVLGIGDATVVSEPSFDETEVPSVTADGKASAVVHNEVRDVLDEADVTLSVITTDGREITVGDAPLLGDDTNKTATFTNRQINGRPGTYTVSTVRATNNGGLFVDYLLASTVTTQISLEKRTESIDITADPEQEPLLYQGWDYDEETGIFSAFGLDLTAADEGIVLPGGTVVDVEEEGTSINVAGGTAIASEGNITIKGEGTADIHAKDAIAADGEVTISSDVEITATGTAVTADTLNIKKGATLTITLSGPDAEVFSEGLKLNIPSNYEAIGGTIADDGTVTMDPGATQLIFREKHEHSYGDWKVVTAATASTPGKKEAVCTGCGTVKSELIPATGAAEADPSNGKLEIYAEVTKEAPAESATINTGKAAIMNASGIFDTTEKTEIVNGDNAKLYITIDALDQSTIPTEDLARIKAAAAALGGSTELTFLDVSLFKQVGTAAPVQIYEPGIEIEVSIELPAELLNTNANVNRTYYIIRDHEGTVDVINGTFNSKTGEVTFKTDKFSPYAIAYNDQAVSDSTKTASDSPKTGDTTNIGILISEMIAMIAAGCFVGAVIVIRKKRFER